MGFCCKVWSLNDLTPSPISRPGTHCLQWQRANARANLWWRHEPFPGETSISLRALCWKSGFANRSWWCLGIIPSDRCCQFSMISQILEDINLSQSAGRRPQTTCFLRTLQCMLITEYAIPIPHVKYRAKILLGWGGAACRTECMLHQVVIIENVMTFATALSILFTSFVHRTNIYWSVIHGIKRKPHLSVVWNWYYFVAIGISHQPRPTDSADINTRLQLSDTSSIPPMHGGFLLISLSLLSIRRHRKLLISKYVSE